MGSKDLEKFDRKEVFENLRDQAIILLANLETFKALFHSDSQTEQLLRETAEDFFSQLNIILHKNIILEIYSLTGSDNTIGKYNLTTQLMTKLVCKEPMTETCREIKNLSKELAIFGKKLRAPRNKIIAHLDLDTYLKGCLLGGFTEEELDTFIRNFEEYFENVGNLVGSEGLRGFYVLDPQMINKPKSDVYGLLTILREARDVGISPWNK